MFKSLGVSSKSAGAAMKDIEILPNEAGVPEVTLHGEAKAAAAAKGISTIHLSLTHSDVSFSLLADWRTRSGCRFPDCTVAIVFVQASTT